MDEFFVVDVIAETEMVTKSSVDNAGEKKTVTKDEIGMCLYVCVRAFLFYFAFSYNNWYVCLCAVVGTPVAKVFEGTTYYGEVTAIHEFWHVTYDDGDGIFIAIVVACTCV